MLIQASHQITKISNNESINSENYLESISYINSLYSFLNNIKKVLPSNSFVFEPTFKGFHTCEKFGLESSLAENEMRRFLIRSDLFLEDKDLERRVNKTMGNICELIIFDKDTIEFILR